MTRATLPEVQIRRVAADDRAAWLRMRYALWPAERGEYGHERDVDTFFAGHSATLDAVLVADARGVGPIGFIEVRVCDDAKRGGAQAAAHVDGWYVEADYRRRRIGTRLRAAAQRRARSAGHAELVSTTSS